VFILRGIYVTLFVMEGAAQSGYWTVARPGPEMGFEEIEERALRSLTPHFRQADFWPGIAFE
jgi:hypothetical protein